MTRPERPSQPRRRDAGESAPRPRTIDSAELLRGEKTVEIVHGGERYRLTVTRNGKLILQK